MSGHYTGHWVIVTGARELDAVGSALVDRVIAAVFFSPPLGLIFGGAWGVDTEALVAAHRHRRIRGTCPLVVVVPGTVAQQPRVAAQAIGAYADEVIQLKLDLSRSRSFQVRNERMLTEGRLRDPEECPVVVAFPVSGVMTGGTRNCIAAARSRALPVEEFALISGAD